jgi:hypothetical protein
MLPGCGPQGDTGLAAAQGGAARPRTRSAGARIITQLQAVVDADGLILDAAQRSALQAARTEAIARAPPARWRHHLMTLFSWQAMT